MIALQMPDGPLHVLCLAAHPDDVEIGCGGTLLSLAARPATSVTFATLTGTPERQDEARAAAEAFVPGAASLFWKLPDGRLPAHWGEVKQALEDVAVDVRPDVVLCPRRTDAHQDHRLVSELVPTVWRDALVLEYEIPKWDGDLAAVDTYVPVSPDIAHRKVALLSQHYRSQVGRDWWDDEVFLGLMRLRGMESRSRYAEGFVIRKSTLALA